MFIDTHCHLFHEYYEDLDSIVKKIESNGIKKVIVNGTNGEDNKEVLNMILCMALLDYIRNLLIQLLIKI